MFTLATRTAFYIYVKPGIADTTVASVWRDALLRVYGAQCPLPYEAAICEVACIEVPLRGVALEAGYLDVSPQGECYRVFLLRTREGCLMQCCLPQPICELDPWQGMPLHLNGFLDQRHLLPLFVARSCHLEVVLV